MKGSASYYLYDHRAQRFYELKDGFVLGRMEGDLKFPGDDLLSRSHCRFHISGNDLYVEDLRSTNQTRVNTVGIRSGVKRRVQLNDLIECGIQRFTLTHQNKYPPANIEDKTRGKKVYKAKKLEDGGLQAQLSKVFTKPTLIVLDKYRYHALRLKQIMVPQFSKKGKNEPEGPRSERAKWVPLTAGLLAGLLCMFFVLKSGLLEASRGFASQHCQNRSESSFCRGLVKRGWISEQGASSLRSGGVVKK